MANTNDQQAVLDTLRGLGLPESLDAAERSTWRRYLPGGKLPWREISAFEAEITKLDQRRAEVAQERAELTERLQAAPQRDMEALAQWQREGQPGPRPEPSGPALETELRRRQEDEVALIRAADSVAAERVGFVERNRSRLVADAAKAEGKALERAQRAVGQLAEARERLVQARRTRLWSELYPAAEAGREPHWQLLGGGLRRVLGVLGLEQMIAAGSVLEALHADAEWIATAASIEQRAALEPREVGQAEREHARDRQLNDAARLRGQLSHDQRAGELAAMRRPV